MGSMNACIFIVFCLMIVDGLSTHDKIDHLIYHKFYEESAQPYRVCRDSLPESQCKNREHECGLKDKAADQVCKRTCGHCPAVSPMSCHSTTHGCCWDNITMSGENGKGCPACKDRNAVCPKFLGQCHQGHIRRMCPITCEVRVCANCFDDAKQATFCPVFKYAGFCEIDPYLMKIYCRSTCNFCETVSGINHEIVINRGVNPPRDADDKSPSSVIGELARKKVSSDGNSDELQELLGDESTIQKKKSAYKKELEDKNGDEDILNMLQEISKNSITNRQDDNVELKSGTSKDKELSKKQDKTVAVLERISLVKEELEKRTEDLLNSLIQDTIVKERSQKKEPKGKKKDGSKREIAELESTLLDMLVKERSKNAP